MDITCQKVNSSVTFTVNSALLAFNGEWMDSCWVLFFLVFCCFLGGFFLVLTFEKEWADDRNKINELLLGFSLFNSTCILEVG